MIVSKNALVEKFLPLMQEVVEKAVTKMHNAGVYADYEEMESDAQLQLLKLAEKYVEESCSQARAYFEKSLWNWLNQRYQNLRALKNVPISYSDDEDFDFTAPPYISDSQYEEAYQEEKRLLKELKSDPVLNKAMKLIRRGGTKLAKEEFGKDYWYREVMPKFKMILELQK